MAKLNLITGTLLKEVIESPINGQISVIKSLAFGTYISVGNLTQSGGILQSIWNKTLKKVKKSMNTEVKNVLVLGLGGGSVAFVIRKYWPDAKITGVDLDPVMIEMGKKYLGLGEIKVDIIIEDALSFLKKQIKKKAKYDLVCIDLYVGDEYPKKFEDAEFIESVKKVINYESAAIFNRLYYGEKRKQAMVFGEKLNEVFSKVNYIFPEANLMFFCRI